MDLYGGQNLLMIYEQWLKENGKTPRTISRYLNIVSDFQSWYVRESGEEYRPDRVSALDLQDYKQYLIRDATYQDAQGNSRRYKISTVNNTIKGLRTYFTYLEEIGQITSNPARKLKPQKLQEQEEEPRWLNRPERSRLLFYVDHQEGTKNPWRFARNRAIVYVFLHAGLRENELVDLDLDDLDFVEDILRVRNGKGGKTRYLPINRDLRRALQEWLEQRGELPTKAVFVSQRGHKRLTTDGVYYYITSLKEKTGIPDLTPHVLRHTFAHDLVERGESLHTVAKLLGHTNINYTRRYVTPSRAEARAAVEKLSEER
jgi:site-specific recombinase XerD